MKLSVVSGGFDPLHIGHLELLERSAAIADKLFVIVNTDEFLANKKGKPFMPLRERMMIVQALKPVNLTIKSIDEENERISAEISNIKNSLSTIDEDIDREKSIVIDDNSNEKFSYRSSNR